MKCALLILFICWFRNEMRFIDFVYLFIRVGVAFLRQTIVNCNKSNKYKLWSRRFASVLYYLRLLISPPMLKVLFQTQVRIIFWCHITYLIVAIRLCFCVICKMDTIFLVQQRNLIHISFYPIQNWQNFHYNNLLLLCIFEAR